MNAALAVHVFCQDGSDCVRVVTLDGEPWFVAADVAAPLGLVNHRSSLALLDEDERGVHTVDTLGGPQLVTVVSESGLYSLILRSRKAEARAFRRWVTSEILPSIRKTGAFSTGHAVPAMPVNYPAALRELAATVEREMAAKAALVSRTLELEAARPAVEFHDQFVQADGLYKVSDVAKVLNVPGLGQKGLFGFLRSHGVLMQGGSTSHNLPYQRHMNLGRFEVKVTKYQRPDGRTVSSKTPYVTPKGVEYIARLVERHRSDR